MTRADLLAKIRKCMALAGSANEHEAAAALARARALMEEYGVDAAEVNVDEATAPIGARSRPPAWEGMLSAAVTRAIPCQAILTESGRTFVGVNPSPEIAAYAYRVLHRQLRKARAEYIATRLKRCTARKTARADSFCEGWAAAVFHKVAELHPKRPLDDVVRTYLARRYPSLASVNSRSGLRGRAAERDFQSGFLQGDDVSLHHGVAGMEAPCLIGGALNRGGGA